MEFLGWIASSFILTKHCQSLFQAMCSSATLVYFRTRFLCKLKFKNEKLKVVTCVPSTVLSTCLCSIYESIEGLLMLPMICLYTQALLILKTQMIHCQRQQLTAAQCRPSISPLKLFANRSMLFVNPLRLCTDSHPSRRAKKRSRLGAKVAQNIFCAVLCKCSS